jgi:uracil-DNA glycosylase family 4
VIGSLFLAGEEGTTGMDASVLKSVREYLQYLIESDVEEIHMPPPLPAEPLADEARSQVEDSTGGNPLEAIREELGECTRCPLSRGRQSIVFGEGNPCADILFVGEAPGSEEDQTGRPFVGRAGQLLNQIIEKGMGLSRPEVYIGNILKCRPPLNRTPQDEEVQDCLPFLQKQIAAIQPRVIVSLGRPAAQALLQVSKPMHQLRGNWHAYEGIPLMPTYHPAYVLRNYTVPIRRQVWEDVQEVMRFLAGR